MTIYAKALNGQEVEHFDESTGVPGEGFLEVLTGWPLPSRPSVIAKPFILDGDVHWGDPRTLAEVINENVVAVDSSADIARASVVGDPVRVKEYERAQQHAEAYQASGWTLEPVPSSVACWAAAKSWTAQEAAEDILAASARWYGALDYIRALRLMVKEDIRKAASNSEADALLATFKATLNQAMQGIQ